MMDVTDASCSQVTKMVPYFSWYKANQSKEVSVLCLILNAIEIPVFIAVKRTNEIPLSFKYGQKYANISQTMPEYAVFMSDSSHHVIDLLDGHG